MPYALDSVAGLPGVEAVSITKLPAAPATPPLCRSGAAQHSYRPNRSRGMGLHVRGSSRSYLRIRRILPFRTSRPRSELNVVHLLLQGKGPAKAGQWQR